MTLPPHRISEGGQTDYPWEREAIDFVLQELPDSDPHLAWPLHELYDAGSGRLYEIDLLVLARSALFLIEIKSHPGVLTGDNQDWTFTEAGAPPRHLSCPYPVTNHKAKVLASLLSYKLKGPRPFVQPLVFVSNPEAEVDLAGGCPEYVVTRETIRQTLVHGLPNRPKKTVVNRPMMKELRSAMRLLGLKPSQANRVAGGFQLKQLVDESESYQEHHAVSTTVPDDTARVRSYLVPKATTTERRHQLERAARREAQVLSRLGHHPSILSYRAYEPEAPLGPAVVFEAFEGGLPLHAFLREEPDLPFDDRLHILQAVVEAVDHCHRSEFLHRNLSPASVLVRRVEDRLEVRVHRFQTAAQSDHTSFGTHHVNQLAEETDRLYQAPEVLRDPRKAVPASDVFSLGCLAWFLFTGEHPATTLNERENHIRDNEGLRIASVRGDLASLDAAIALATESGEINRPDNALDWFETCVLEDLTRPAQPDDERRDPYEAEKGQKLAGNILVDRVLGSGATAKVFRVTRDGRAFALKVPHDEGCAQRLVEEGRVIARLRHQNIIQLHDTLELGNRHCLLLDYAGAGDEDDTRHSSFADLLRAEGTLSLEKARRYGGDLLAAVQYLDEQGITHRDIKPGNLGFTAQAKKARHLTLYDFSLAAGEATSVRSGTPEWRDPWLHLRGRWDSAADRFSAATVLYRMLTGTRPEVAEDGPSQGQVRIEAERFDPAVRDRMTTFFERCFMENVADRYPSTEEMRLAWDALFSTVESDDQPSEHEKSADEILASATLTTPIEALPLSARARNALDRAGVLTVDHLLQLPRNHLSAIRGVGHNVAKEIVAIAALLGERLSITETPPLAPDFTGPRLGLVSPDIDLSSRVVNKLHDAGVTSTTDLAHMPADWANRLLGSDGAASAIATLQKITELFPPEGTLSQWVNDLLAPLKKKKTAAESRVRALVGLDPLPGDEDNTEPGTRSVTQVAKAFGVAPPLIHSSLQATRRRWDGSGCLDQFEAAITGVMASLEPVAQMEIVAANLAEIHGGVEDADDNRTHALGLIRVATELRPAVLYWRRLGETAWVAESLEALDALTALAAEADEIAKIVPLASTDGVRERLIAQTSGTVLEEIPADRLVKLAARASSKAAASTRLELYPRGMPAGRALKLSLNVLTPPGLTPDGVQQRVSSRYPEAQPLPGRPDLDNLLLEHELFFDLQSQSYVRQGESHTSISGTIQLPTRQSSAQPHELRSKSPEALEAQAFQDALDRGIESGRFRVVQVRADFSEKAITLLAEKMGVEPVSLDHRIWDLMQAKASELGVDPELMLTTDRQGPGSEEWEHLQELARLATEEVIESLLASREKPALLVHPGALARFELREALATLSQRAQTEDGAAVVLVIPSHADGLGPIINNQLPVPTEAGGQRLRMPESWLANKHRAAATDGTSHAN